MTTNDDQARSDHPRVISIADLRDDDWDEIEDGLCMSVDEAMNQAHMRAGRLPRETMYKAQAEHTRAVLDKVKKLRAGTRLAFGLAQEKT